MNKTISMGRLTDEPKITYTQTGKCKAEFNLALQRSKEGADFPRFIAWEKTGELIEKSVHKGDRLLVEGHIQTGSYDNKEGKKVYTTDIICDRIEFIEPKAKDGSEGQPDENPEGGFVKIPEGIQEELPFK